MRAFMCDCVGAQSEHLVENAIELIAECLNEEQTDVVVDAQALYKLNSEHRLVNRAQCLDTDPLHHVGLCDVAFQRSPPRDVLPSSFSEFIGELVADKDILLVLT